MLLSVSTSPMNTRLSDRESIRLIKDAGFDAYDMSLCEMMFNPNYIFNTDKYLEEAKSIREYADGLGLVCNQAHAPFTQAAATPKKTKTPSI